MIKVSELRIGNYIYLGGNTINTYQTYKPSKVTIKILEDIFDENSERGNDYILSVYKPLLLTPEILKSCGFDEDLRLTLNIEMDLLYDKDSKSVTLWAHFDFPAQSIKYLHQLQNLYFALTGEELTVNLNVATPI